MQATYVVVGNSAAGLAAAQWARRYDARGSILVLTEETGPTYSRVALPYYVAGERRLEDIVLRTAADYDRMGARCLAGARAVGLDPAERRLHLADGRSVRYERLCLATGSVPAVPAIPGLEEVGAFPLWTLADADRLRAALRHARRAVVIGGGFIGMLIAEALVKRGREVTVVEATAQLLPQLLDAEAAARFAEAVRGRGVTLRLRRRVIEARRAEDGTARLRLDDGSELAADLVAVATGVRPNVELVSRGPCRVATGIEVDDRLRTTCPGVYAAGDVAEATDLLTGARAVHAIWPTAVEQGRVAGANMAGADLRYGGSLAMNVVGLFGVTLAQIGRFREGPGDRAERLGGGGYRKIVVDHSDRLVGALYLGEPGGVAEMGVLQAMIKRGARWRALPAGLRRITYAVQWMPPARTAEQPA